MRKLLGARAGLSLVLLAGSAVLVLAILIGNNMGSRVIASLAQRPTAFSTTPIPIPTATLVDPQSLAEVGRRHEALSVATDPGFPDPRVTPEPPPPETPKPKPKPSKTPSPPPETPNPDDNYTSPPLPLPIVSHDASETSSPDAAASPDAAGASPHPGATATPHQAGRGYPTLPPVQYPTGSPG